MRIIRPLATAAAVALAAACSDGGPTAPRDTAADTDYAAVSFGPTASALEGTLGPQRGRPFDGRTAAARLPDSLALSEAQKAQIAALRSAFEAENRAALKQLTAAFEAARQAREDGKSREEIRAILDAVKPVAEGLRPKVQALHEAIQAVLTPAQKAWLDGKRRG
jgi:Spy/CpxP family protein refolding chaperone